MSPLQTLNISALFFQHYHPSLLKHLFFHQVSECLMQRAMLAGV